MAQQFTAESTNDNSADSEPRLVDLVADYLRRSTASDRVELGKKIREKASNRIDDVAVALREAQIWDENIPTNGSLDFSDQPHIAAEFAYQLPLGYDSKKPYCLVFKLASNPLHPTPTISAMLESAIGEAIVITPRNEFCDKRRLGFRRILRAVGTKLHIDTSRVFIEGMRQGADAAWEVATSFSDLPAGISTSLGYLEVPYRKQMYDLILPNIRPMAGVSSCMIDGVPEDSEVYMADLCCRAMKKAATDKQLAIQFFAGGYELEDFFRAYDAFKDIRRPTIPLQLSHYFRYPEQGQCAWLRQTKFAGDVWTAEQLSILPGPDVDADQYITDVLKSLLAYMGGTIEGNTIRIETRRCADIELLLYEDMVDFTRSVVVYINGKKRHDRIVKPSIPTLLEEAYDTFDFQRLVFAKLPFDIKEDSTAPPGK